MDSNVYLGITDHLEPTVRAMLMAQYSRSNKSIKDRLNENKSEDLKKSLSKYYTDYGHKSVGQLGSTTIYIENVSMIAAKVIENNKLFNGQEVSSRYIDFSNVSFYSTCNEITIFQEHFRNIYVNCLNNTIKFLKEKYPFNQQKHNEKFKLEKNESIYENTIKARAFDICRGLIPAGAKTSLCYYGTFDNINDHFGELIFHPLDEVKEIALNVLNQLSIKYPEAAIPLEKIKRNNSYLTNEHFYSYYDPSEVYTQKNNFAKLELISGGVDLKKLKYFLETREIYNKIPDSISNNINMDCYGFIDYGSYRDIHRHRNGSITFPILTNQFGFNKYYLDELDDYSRKYVMDNLLDFDNEIRKSSLTNLELQYVMPLGYVVPFNYKCNLNQFLYISTLRSSKTVHQTLRRLIHDWNCFDLVDFPIMNDINNLISKHVDFTVDNFTLKRGQQTFNI